MMENAQKKEKLDVRARPYKEGRPRWVGFIQDGSYLVGKAMTAHGMPKPSPTEGAGAVEGTERAREGCFVPELKGLINYRDRKKLRFSKINFFSPPMAKDGVPGARVPVCFIREV